MPEKHNKCSCNICKRHQWLKEVIEKRDIDELINAVEELSIKLECSEMDNDVYNIIMKGFWPNSVNHLSHALRRAIEHEENQQKKNKRS